MSNPWSSLLAAFSVEDELGRLLWERGGVRCYRRSDPAGSTLTTVTGDREVRYELAGVDDGCLS